MTTATTTDRPKPRSEAQAFEFLERLTALVLAWSFEGHDALRARRQGLFTALAVGMLVAAAAVSPRRPSPR